MLTEERYAAILRLLAAKKAGIKTVIVPEKNRRDIKEIDAEITDGLEIVYAENMTKVIKTAFVKKQEPVSFPEKAFDPG